MIWARSWFSVIIIVVRSVFQPDRRPKGILARRRRFAKRTVRHLDWHNSKFVVMRKSDLKFITMMCYCLIESFSYVFQYYRREIRNDIECAGVSALNRAHFFLFEISRDSEFFNFELWQSCSRGANRNEFVNRLSGPPGEIQRRTVVRPSPGFECRKTRPDG